MRRRYAPEGLLELLEDPCLWNLSCAAIEAGPAILAMHGRGPALPPERPRHYIAAAMRREAESVLSTPLESRPAAIRKARRSLERFVLEGLAARELDAFLGRLEARHG